MEKFSFRLRLSGLGLALCSLVGELWRMSLSGWKSHNQSQGSEGKGSADRKADRQTDRVTWRLGRGPQPFLSPDFPLRSLVSFQKREVDRSTMHTDFKTCVSHCLLAGLCAACFPLSSPPLCLPPGLLPCSNPESCVIQAYLTWTDPHLRRLWRGN